MVLSQLPGSQHCSCSLLDRISCSIFNITAVPRSSPQPAEPSERAPIAPHPHLVPGRRTGPNPTGRRHLEERRGGTALWGRGGRQLPGSRRTDAHSRPPQSPPRPPAGLGAAAGPGEARAAAELGARLRRGGARRPHLRPHPRPHPQVGGAGAAPRPRPPPRCFGGAATRCAAEPAGLWLRRRCCRARTITRARSSG